jgi:hypothetical protein
MAIKSCHVSCTDASGVDHSVKVTAETLYEAIAQALRLFRENDWTGDVQRIPSLLTVRVKHPVMEHRVRIRDFEAWLDSAPKSPTEMVLKKRLRELLGR